jgi:hypothetical protein
MKYRWHICRFDSTEHLTGKQRTYQNIKEAALKALLFGFTLSILLLDAIFTELKRLADKG